MNAFCHLKTLCLYFLVCPFQIVCPLVFRNVMMSKCPTRSDSKLFAMQLQRPTNIRSLADVVQFGKDYFDLNNHIIPVDQLNHKVPGCASVVQLAVKLTTSKFISDHDVDQSANTMVSVVGSADSLVAQGMLAVLCNGLEGVSVQRLRSLSAKDMADVLGLLPVLATEQLKGFCSMFGLVSRLADEQLISGGCGTSPQLPSDPNVDKRDSLDRDSHADEVAVLLSGGVDSSVALRLLLDRGCAVRAYYLRIWLEDELAHLTECPWEDDLRYARAVCDQLRVPLEVVSLQKEYHESVVRYTLREARAGRTPNPDVLCNSAIKFGAFHDYVGRYHSMVATGHYAQVERNDATGLVALKQSPDAVKDQSYFLCNLTQRQLKRCVFPIGHLDKRTVRELAVRFDLPTQARPDSQGICFLGRLRFDSFVQHYLGECPGDIVRFETGAVIGRHRGLWFHTVGQRKGVGLLLGPRTNHGGPFYVVGKDVAANVLYVTARLELVDAPRKAFQVQRVNWIAGEPPAELVAATAAGGIGPSRRWAAEVKLRHGPQIHVALVSCVTAAATAIAEDTMYAVELNDHDQGIAPGQFAAFYRDGECLGGGVVC